MIKLLPEDVWARIAAGEVVERPASVVKELVENALDVGSTRVRVSLWDGGRSRIVVEDNGAGIPFDELPLAVAQHATSKLSSADELDAILTLGYRGEALASIASVSRMEIRSLHEGEGAFIRVAEGRTTEHLKTSCSEGTRVQVDDLFFNLPARRKFMKTALSEARRCLQITRDYALAWPRVSFGFSTDGKSSFTTDGSGDRKRTVSLLWGNSPEPREVSAAAGSLTAECWYQPFPGRGRNEVSAFVNGRAVNDPLIRGAVSSAARDIPGNWAIFFSVDPQLIDVNIHPAKAEIRFRHTGDVFEVVKKCADAITSQTPNLYFAPASEKGAGGFSVGRDEFFGSRAAPLTRLSPPPRAALSSYVKPQSLFSRVPTDDTRLEGLPDDTRFTAFEPSDERDADAPKSEARSTNCKFISQLECGYLLYESDGELLIVDPHAAHERVMFERIRRRAKDGIRQQSLLHPEQLPPTLVADVEEHREKLESLGFAFSDDNGLSVSALPSPLDGGTSAAAILRATLAAMNENADGAETGVDDQLMASWAVCACKSAVKLTTRLTREEAEALRLDMEACENPNACPHGRPTTLVLSRAELGKYFARD